VILELTEASLPMECVQISQTEKVPNVTFVSNLPIVSMAVPHTIEFAGE